MAWYLHAEFAGGLGCQLTVELSVGLMGGFRVLGLLEALVQV